MPTSTDPTASPKDVAAQAPRYLPLETVAIHLTGAGSESGQPILGVLSNLSDTGACIITNLPVEVGRNVVLELESPRWSDKVAIAAGVMWCDEGMEPVKEIVGFLSGLRFVEGSGQAVERLLKSGIFQLIP